MNTTGSATRQASEQKEPETSGEKLHMDLDIILMVQEKI